MRQFRPYPAYKDSGVEWLGCIPAHWELRRLKTVASVELSNVDKKSVDGQVSVMLCNYTHVYNNDRITSDLDFMSATATREQLGRFSLRAGDVLITKDSESWTDIAVPALVGSSDFTNVLCGYHLALVRPAQDCLGPYLFRAFSAIGPRHQFRVGATGVTRFGISRDAIRTGLFAIPSAAEQLAIAAFLDRETARIDSLVAKKQRLIERLQDMRTALITRAATRGLDSSVATKDSGVEWLTGIPSHWAVKKIKHLIREPLAYGVLKPDRYAGADGIRLIRILDIEAGDVHDKQLERVSPAQSLEYRRTIVAPGDLVMSVVGTIGRTFVVPDALGGANLSRALARIQLRLSVNTKFIDYCFSAEPFLNFTQLIPAGTAQRVLNLSDLGNYLLGLPDSSEQAAIVQWLATKLPRLDSLITHVGEAIDRLEELRAALVSEAVTGKIDVREQAVA